MVSTQKYALIVAFLILLIASALSMEANAAFTFESTGDYLIISSEEIRLVIQKLGTTDYCTKGLVNISLTYFTDSKEVSYIYCVDERALLKMLNDKIMDYDPGLLAALMLTLEAIDKDWLNGIHINVMLKLTPYEDSFFTMITTPSRFYIAFVYNRNVKLYEIGEDDFKNIILAMNNLLMIGPEGMGQRYVSTDIKEKGETPITTHSTPTLFSKGVGEYEDYIGRDYYRTPIIIVSLSLGISALLFIFFKKIIM